MSDARPVRWRKRDLLALTVALVASAVSGIYGYTVDPRLQLAGIVLSLLLALLVLAGAANVVASWSRDRWRALFLLGFALGGCIVSVGALQAGIGVRNRQFVREMRPYERLVGDFKTGAVKPGALAIDSLPPALRDCCYRVQGTRDSAGVWQVEFFWARGFPTHHSAWVYSSGTSRAAVKQRGQWYHAAELAPHWYRVSD